MLPCARFFFALSGFVCGLVLFWTLMLNLFTNGCPTYENRTCNNRGQCDQFGVCHCDPLFSGNACENTGVFGYLKTTNELCSGRGTVLQHYAYTFPECQETQPSLLFPRTGGWNTTACRNRLSLARKRIYYYENAEEEDFAGVPMCLCRPGFAGPGCDEACPLSIDEEICSENGNKTVGLMRNGTTGNGCQCAYPPLQIVNAAPYLNKAQAKEIQLNPEAYRDGLCARVVTLEFKSLSVVVPHVGNPYRCICDERHYGEVCEFGVCPQTEEGAFCSGNGHKRLGFGAERNTTRSESAFGEPGTPLCTVGKNGCCVENQALCTVPELSCPLDRPYRCSTTKLCVGVPRISRCDQGWQYAYWDDPNRAPRREARLGLNELRSELLAYFFRIQNGTLEFDYEGKTYIAPESKEFWGGVMTRTVSSAAQHEFDSNDETRVEFDGTEMTPAHFVHGDDDYDRVVRLRSNYDQYVVVDVVGSRVDTDVAALTPDAFILANLSSDAFLRPGGSVVELSTCLDDLRSCGWTMSGGPFYLCFRDGRLGSSRASCPFPSHIPFVYARTVALVRPRVSTRASPRDSIWYAQFTRASRYSFVVRATGTWSGQLVTLDDARIPCACEPPIGSAQNVSAWNARWMLERTRPRANVNAGFALAKINVWGDAKLVRGTLVSSTKIIDDYGDEHENNIVATKIITREETSRGVPSPDDRVFPHRCPDGKGARSIMRELRDVTGNATCTLTSRGATCTNQCTCSLARCVCAEPESERPTFDIVTSKRDFPNACFVIRPNRGNWTRSGNCFQFSSFDVPLEFRGANITSARARFYGGAWFDVRLEIDERAAYPVIDDVTKPFDEWCVESDSVVQPEILPIGISAYRARPDFQLRPSENEADVQNVVWNDLTHWSSTDRGYLRVDFPEKPLRLIGLFISFRTMGLYLNEEVGAINATITVHVGDTSARDAFRADWTWAADLIGDVVNGTEHRYVELEPQLVGSVRILSRFPMSIWRFIPVTDQLCDAGTLVPGNQYPEDVISRRSRRIDANATLCVSDDSCVLSGESAANDGICSDYKHVTWGLTPRETTRIVQNLTALEVITLNFGETEDANVSCVKSCCVWGSGVLPAHSCQNDSLVYVSDRAVAALTLGPPNYVKRDRVLIWGDNLIEGENTCANGTDYTDCGASARLDSMDPGLSCEPTAFEIAFETRNVSEREFRSSASIRDLLGMGMRLQFNMTYVRDKMVLSRGPCGDCDGRARCKDGTCVDDPAKCPVTYYDTPGDGCVRLDVNRKSYKCACAVGWSGFACDKGKCTNLDFNTGRGDPHEWCTCGGPNERKYSKIRVKPPFLFAQKSEGYTRKDILRMNRARRRVSERDVGWENVRFTEAPWGVAIKRQFVRGGVTRYSNCPFLVRVPDGRLVELEDCVAERSEQFPHEVTRWKEWTMLNGSRMTIAWDGPWFETKYDDAPYRCGSTCVSDERECYVNNYVNPPCGKRGECRADGTCICEAGWETFVLTKRLSQAAAIPYASKDGESDPTAWTTPDPIWFDTAVCGARNCTTVDCSPPYGCFVGTQSLAFADRNITCDASTGHRGMCAFDSAACRRGDVAPPIPCSGNGILRKRDYKDEWYCECGSPRSVLKKATDQDVRETSELVPNGFAGPRCDQYFCQEDLGKIWLQRTNPRTNLPYVGSDGVSLPYKWRGPCDAPVGPKIEDMGFWRQCCDKKRLDQCERVPCLKGRTDKKYVACEKPELCLDSTSQPLVYPCNGHGKPLADGSCECDVSSTEGYTYDETIWSGKGCIRRSQCEIAQSSGTMCNKKKDCGDFESWSEIPYIPYFEQQWPSLLTRAGLPPTNQTFVDLVFRDDREQRLQYVASQQAQKVEDAITAAAETICVYPNDDPSNPKGMAPYDPAKTCTYGQGYKLPYLLENYRVLSRPAQVTRALQDGVFGDASKIENVHFTRLRRDASTSDFDPKSFLHIEFARPAQIRVIRIRAKTNIANSLRVVDASAGVGSICSDLFIRSTTSFEWAGGSQGAHYCISTYENFNFQSAEYALRFQSQCRPNEFSSTCTKWKDEICTALRHEIQVPGEFLKVLRGCTDRCCVRVQTASEEYVRGIQLRLPPSSETRIVDVDEVQIYGSYEKSNDMSSSMQNEIKRELPNHKNCRDTKLLLNVFDQSLSAHLAKNWTGFQTVPAADENLDFDRAVSLCENMGSRLGANRAASSVEAEVLGAACYAESSLKGCMVNARERGSPKFINSSTEIIKSSCATWGCWTPYWPLNEVDLFSTGKNDTSGLQWKSEWAGSDYVTLQDAITHLYSEAKFQSELTLLRDYIIIGEVQIPRIQYHDFPHLNLQTMISSYEQTETFRDFAVKHLYRLFPPSFSMPILFPTIQTPTNDPRPANKSIWTNPKICIVSVYSRPGCGSLQTKPNSFPWTIFMEKLDKKDMDRFDGLSFGARRTFVVTPRDDYSILRETNILDIPNENTFNECLNILCDRMKGGVGSYLVENAQSISVSGPCALEIIGYSTSKDNVVGVYGTYAHYVTGAQRKPAFAHFASGDYKDKRGRWVDGCYGDFNRPEPFNTFQENVEVQPQTSTLNGENTNDLKTQRRSRFPSKGLRDMRWLSVRVIAKFTSRKLDIDYRPNQYESIPRNDNAYVLGYEDHAYMCTRVRVVEKMRVYAGVRFPEKLNRVIYDGPSRIKRQTIAHSLDRWKTQPISNSPNKPPIFTTTPVDIINEPFDWYTNVPRESMSGTYEFTAAELREGMQQLVNIGYQIVPRSDITLINLGGYPFTFWELNLDQNALCATFSNGEYTEFYDASFVAHTRTVGDDWIRQIFRSYRLLYDTELTEPILSNGQITQGVAFENSEVVLPYSKCDGVELPRQVRKCSDCPAPRTAKWEWNQQFFNPENLRFNRQINSMAQLPQIHVSFNSTKYRIVEPYTPIASYEITRPDAYARLMSIFTVPDYRRDITSVNATTPAYHLDSCVAVRQVSDRNYEFVPTVCENPVHRAVCVRDYMRFAIQSGCQCDECGPDSRSTPYQPNTTAFDLFPLSKRENFPIEHDIKDAWKSGQLETFFQFNPLPANAVMSFLLSTNQSFIHAFPGFYRAFWMGISDRAGFLSRGQIENPDAWIDFDFKRMFPYSCGVVYSRFTGEGRPMCAKSAEFCTRDQTFSSSRMNKIDYPTSLRALPDAENPRVKPQCGRFVRPWDLLKPTEDDPPPPTQGEFLLLEKTEDDYVTIRALKTDQAYVRNTYRDVDVVKPGSVLAGSIECSAYCEVRVWIGSLNPFFQESERKLDLGIVIPDVKKTYEFEVSREADLSYRTLGWDVIRATRGTVIKIGRALITDDDSIAECKKDKTSAIWLEPPANVDSPAPQHQCVFTDRAAQILRARDVGVCYCSPASPYGGPTCEWPATISKHGKRVCNAFAGVRKSKSKEIAPNGDTVAVNEWGVYSYTSFGQLRFACKTRSDVGSIIKSRMIPQSMSDFRYVVKSLAKPNEEEFVKLNEDELKQIRVDVPIIARFARDACNAFSFALPSFTTADEISSYLNTNPGVSFLDLHGALQWDERGESLRVNTTTTYTDPCAQDALVCAALHFNNYLFNSSANSFLVDGRPIARFLNTTTTLSVRTDLEPKSKLLIQIVGCAEASEIVIRAFNGTFHTCPDIDERTNSTTCTLASAITHIQVIPFLLGMEISEIGAFADDARTYIFS